MHVAAADALIRDFFINTCPLLWTLIDHCCHGSWTLYFSLLIKFATTILYLLLLWCVYIQYIIFFLFRYSLWKKPCGLWFASLLFILWIMLLTDKPHWLTGNSSYTNFSVCVSCNWPDDSGPVVEYFLMSLVWNISGLCLTSIDSRCRLIQWTLVFCLVAALIKASL